MDHGEKLINRHWYDFEDSTGALQYGFVYLKSSQKWVFYDRHMGWMLYGEQPVDGSWYLLDNNTGAVKYGWQTLTDKLVCYDWPSGKMLHGRASVNGGSYYFDDITGRLDSSRSDHIPTVSLRPVQREFGSKISSGEIHSVRIIGDSIAAGVGASITFPTTTNKLFELEGVTFYEPSYQTDMAINSLRFYLKTKGVDMVNSSAPGKGSYSAYNSIDDATLGNEDAAIVMLGANDRLKLSNQGEFRDAAESYLKSVVSHYGVDNVLILSNIDALSDPRPLTMDQENTVLEDLCKSRGWHFASLYSAFRDLGRSTGIPQQGLYVDGIHPNNKGQVLLWNALSQLLGLQLFYCLIDLLSFILYFFNSKHVFLYEKRRAYNFIYQN